MTCMPSGGALNPPRAWTPPPRQAMTYCKACGGGHPTKWAISPMYEGHLRLCSGRSLEKALDNLREMAECPPAEWIVDQELAYIKKRIMTRKAG